MALAVDPNNLATNGLGLYTYFAHWKTAGVAEPFRLSAFPPKNSLTDRRQAN
jgi:hypothetical protein